LDAESPNIEAMLDLAYQLVLCQLEADVYRAKQDIREMVVPIKILLLKEMEQDTQICGWTILVPRWRYFPACVSAQLFPNTRPLQLARQGPIFWSRDS
jgi:hypothetical protein